MDRVHEWAAPDLESVTLAVRHLVNASHTFSERTAGELEGNSTDTVAPPMLDQHAPTNQVELAISSTPTSAAERASFTAGPPRILVINEISSGLGVRDRQVVQRFLDVVMERIMGDAGVGESR